MGWKELYKPTFAKIIIPVILYIIILIQIIRMAFGGGFYMCETDCTTNMLTTVGTAGLWLVLIIIFVYPISCWVYALAQRITAKK